MLAQDLALNDIFHSSGNPYRALTYEDYARLKKYLDNGFVTIERVKLARIDEGVFEKLYRFLIDHQVWTEIDMSRCIPELRQIQNGGGRTHNSLGLSLSLTICIGERTILA